MEINISKEMIAAGIEALLAARRDCLTDFEIVAEIYLSMYAVGSFMESEPLH